MIAMPEARAETLPVAEVLPALLEALAHAPNALLVAPPGAGKTTLVPLALLQAPWRQDGSILVLEPRRLAARAAATRMATLLGERVGETVGYRTRFDSAVSAATRVEVVTEGLLVRRLQSDPGLSGVAAVLLDEVHERSLDADLALALCLDLQRGLRPELRLLAMSATADAARLARLLEAPVIESAGRAHPVVIRHAARDLQAARDLPDALARAVRAALAEEAGDILAFLPGMGEIRRAQAALADCGALVLPLHGELPLPEQDRALRPDPSGHRRVVLATSVAETSLTVPGVRIVVDGGWRRAPRLDTGSGLTRLATLRISRAAADQRAGRAGREAPGLAIRLWTEALHRGLPAFDRPEILEADLAGLVLDCAGWGARPEDLAFPDPPSAGALAAARALLAQLGALDGEHRITEAGRAMARLGAHPRLGAMLLAAEAPGLRALACDLAALLEERDPMRGSRDRKADIALRLAAIAGDPSPEADRGTLARIRTASAQFRRRLGLATNAQPSGDPGALLASGFPDRLAQRRGEPGSFRLSGGGGARLSVADPLARAPFLIAPHLEMKTAAEIRLAAPVDPACLPPALASQITETVETSLDAATKTVLTRRRRRFGALILEDRTEQAAPALVAEALAETVALPWSEPSRQLQARVGLMRSLEGPESWPDMSDPALDADRAWFAPYLSGLRDAASVARLDLASILRGLLTWEQLTRLDRELPAHIALPGGRAPVDYTQPVPVAGARAQWFYGLAETPRLAGGRIDLRLALLSPAGRPLALTGDLAGFWRAGWHDVRRDVRGRYPKHDWPEDPASAPAHSSGRKRP